MKVALALVLTAAAAHADPLRTPDVVCRDPGKGKLELLADAPFVETQRPALIDAAAAECERDGWTPPVRACFAAVRDADAAWACVDQLPVTGRERLEAAVVRAVPPKPELAGDKVELHGRFVFSNDRVSSEAEATLDQIAKLLGNKPGLRVDVRVHGEAGFDRKRTQVRADAIKRLLLDRLKMPADRITAVGVGDTEPRGPNRTARERAHNRRVELTFKTALDNTTVESTGPVDVRPPTAGDLVGYITGLPGRGSKLRASIDTSHGMLTCDLLPEKAPMTVANFIGLATAQKPFLDPATGNQTKRRYYDGLTFHRVIPGFMIQGGDPVGTGVGGPGYRFADEIHDQNQVDAGSLVMANAGPNTNGSQFFIAETRTARLDASYTVFGKCTPISVVKKIANVPRSSMDKPTTPVVIRTITITRVP